MHVDPSFLWTIGFAWLLGMIILWGILYSSGSTPGEDDQEELDAARMKRYIEREWSKAAAGAANADQWAKDLVETWKRMQRK
jgi:hypothetical protein